ncbi:hypothetical protein [Thauera propionica]|uniref:hypothetical protein n=1 Tax=Thauera propionica TaxID=2019431 RepID=UPI001055C6F6|nr:hypothetical protein [Thauera propionica]
MKYSKTTNGFYAESIHGAATPSDAIEITTAQHAALLAAQSAGKVIAPDANGYPVAQDPPPPPAPTAEQIRADRVAAVYAHLNTAAQALGYDDIRAAVTYADEPAVPKFQAEGRAFRAWRSLVWAHCYQVLDDVQAGLRPIPTAEDLIAELPELSITYPE